MKTLNLVDLEKSDIKYKKILFPDGQQNIIIQEVGLRKASGSLPCKYECDCVNPANYPYQIKSRLNNWLDLELIICSVAALRELGVEEIHLYTPYIVGARSDRKFEEGGNNYLKDVICPIINSLNFKTVTCIDPHSDVLEACIKGFRKEDNLKLVKFALKQLDKQAYTSEGKKIDFAVKKGDIVKEKEFILISPDAGANKKIYKLAEQIGYKGNIITCSKDRDVEGKLTKCVVPVKDTGPLIMKDYIIIDDICDGGATFINIAKELKKLYNCNHIYLIVTHGIFSKGFDELAKYFNGIYCTNSYKDITYYGEGKSYEPIIKQLNVF